MPGGDWGERVRKDGLTARAVFEASIDTPVPHIDFRDHPWTVRKFLSLDHWRTVCNERTFRYYNEDVKHTCVVQFDVLKYTPSTNELWVIDFKTSGETVFDKSRNLTFDFQTKHYLYALRHLVESGYLAEHFDVPPDAKVGGIIHVLIQRPAIRISNEDRDYEEVEKKKWAGTKREQTVTEMQPVGEPLFANYLARVHEWYTGTGRYETDALRVAREPRVHRSVIRSSILTDDDYQEYTATARAIADMAKREPYPANFPRIAAVNWKKSSPLLDLYTMPVVDWPEWIVRNNITQSHRNAEPATTDTTVI